MDGIDGETDVIGIRVATSGCGGDCGCGGTGIIGTAGENVTGFRMTGARGGAGGGGDGGYGGDGCWYGGLGIGANAPVDDATGSVQTICPLIGFRTPTTYV
jgi:hypothetical protein